MRRKVIFITLGIVACALIALAALPWWLGAALKVGGRSFGLTFGEYRRIGYTRFALKDVEVRQPGVEVKATQVELATPLLWVVRRPGELTIGRWSVVVTPTDAPEDESRVKGWQPLRARLGKIIDQLDRWLPPATAGEGEVSWAGGELTMTAAEWKQTGESRLDVAGLRWRDEVAEVLVKHDSAGGELIVEARATDGEWDAKVKSEGGQLVGSGRWWGQPVELQARFAEAGWKPVEAKFEAIDWRLPAARVELGDYYDVIAGRAEIAWRDDAFSLDAHAEGRPRTGNEMPPMQVRVHGAGGLEQVSIDRLDVQVPGIEGHLSEPITLGRDGRLRSGASRFDLTVDLAKQPWFGGRGTVSGAVQVTPQDGRAPLVRATLTTNDATVADWVATHAEMDLTLAWPVLTVNTATVKLSGGDALVLDGEWNIRTRVLTDGRITGRVSHDTAGRWLTADAGFETLEIDATASGTWPLIKHQGHAKTVGLRVSPLRPLDADMEWAGEGTTLDAVGINAIAGATRLNARGAVGAVEARIDELILTQAEAGTQVERLRLSAPMRVQWKPTITIAPFHLKGTEGDVSGRLVWGATGDVKMNVTRFDSRWLDELVAMSGQPWAVTAFALDGAWDRGPMTFTASGAGQVDFTGGRHAELAMSAKGDANGVKIETLRAAMDQRQVMRAHGALPITINPGQTPLWRVDETGPLSLDAATEPNAFFWQQFTAMTGLIVTDPEVHLTLGGTVRAPLGEATMRIGKIAPDGTGRLRAWPEIEALEARMTGDRSGVALDTFSLKVAGQLVRASGLLPVKQWAALVKDPLALAKAGGEARIEIPDAEVAALARYAPAYLAPTGTLHVDVALRPGGQLEGIIRLRDAATRPLGPLGTLQSIGAEILLAGRTIELKQVRATAGGQPVNLSGKVEFPDGKAPRLDLALRGENLPFARQAGLLMRGDLDLRIVTNDSEVTEITGTTRLRSSFFLMDVRALLPKGGARNAPGRRPPYFAVDVPPFNDWRLDVAVDGDRFLRLRTPLFTGLASAHFRLRGTLGDPRATGEAVVNEGKVLLPFATFNVRQGDVRLTETNPFEPRISLVGTSRRFGYDLRMEVSGTVEKPRLTFSSTPPLESEQVLLMVMAGETPQNEMTYTSRDRAARLGAYLGQSLLKQLGGNPEATERLSVTVGERISRQGRETYGVEYELTPRWSLVGEYDEFDEYNVGVKWRVWSEKDGNEEHKDQKTEAENDGNE